MLTSKQQRRLAEAVEIGSPLDGEAMRLSGWRRGHMLRLGYDEDVASEYAEHWYELDQLIQGGCPLGLALDIVL